MNNSVINKELNPVSFKPNDSDLVKLKKPGVAVILGYFNGQKYIDDQLESIFSQSHQHFHVYISDDHSNINLNLDNLDINKNNIGKVTIINRSRNVGYVNNFLTTLADITDEFAYFAFSDQDDIWRDNKLEKAVNVLAKIAPDTPALYCARTEISDATCEHIVGYSTMFGKPPAFQNALVQSIAGGNTMVFNKAARDIIVATAEHNIVASHDWWSYLIITGVGGHVFYDVDPCLKYRQHKNNISGENITWQAILNRIYGLLRGEARRLNNTNVSALEKHQHLLTSDNLEIFNDFMQARNSGFFKRLVMMKRAGVHRQTLFGNIGLFIGVILNKV